MLFRFYLTSQKSSSVIVVKLITVSCLTAMQALSQKEKKTCPNYVKYWVITFYFSFEQNKIKANVNTNAVVLKCCSSVGSLMIEAQFSWKGWVTTMEVSLIFRAFLYSQRINGKREVRLRLQHQDTLKQNLEAFNVSPDCYESSVHMRATLDDMCLTGIHTFKNKTERSIT